jgi:hypothetical protein
MKEKDNDGLLAYIESQGSAEPFKILSVDELMELIMLIDSSPPDLSQQISKLLNRINYYDTER